MSFSVSSSKLTGRPDNAGWSQVYDFEPEDRAQFQKKGHLYAMIATPKLFSDVDGVAAGREILSRVQEEYFGGSELKRNEEGAESPLITLKTALGKVVREFSQRGGVQIGAIVLRNNTLYLVSAGGAKICLIRGGVFSPILESAENDIKSASGFIKNDDSFLIGSSSFFAKFAEGTIKAAIDPDNLTSFTDYFAPIVHSSSSVGDTAFILINFKESAPLSFGEPADIKIPVMEQSLASPQQKTEKSGDSVFHPKLLATPGFFKKLFERKAYVNSDDWSEESRRRRKVSASVGVLLLILLSVSIFFGIRQKELLDYRKNFENDLTSAKHSLDEAENLKILNPERSRELFLEGKSKVLGLSSQGFEDAELDDLKKEIQEIQGSILGEYESTTQMFIDLSLLSDGFNGFNIILTDGLIYTFDPGSRKIVKTEISNKHSELVAGPSKIDENSQLAVYLDNLYLVSSRGVFDITDEKKEILDKSWEGEVLVYAYAGNLYILEKSKSKIWRYAGGAEGNFASGREWLSQSVQVDLSSSRSMVINGSVWILDGSGKIYKFTLGNLQKFELTQEYRDIKPDFIFTGDETQYLYILDKAGGKILVFTKDGEYKAQYLADDIKNTSQIVVSEKEGKIILLSGGNLLSIEIKHL